MKKTMAMLALFALGGCAVPTTGVIPRGDGLFTVSHQGATAFHATDPLKLAATQEGMAYCEKLGKTFKFIHSKEIQGRPAQYPESEVLFKCE